MKTWLVLLISLSIVFKLNAQSLSHSISTDSILLGNKFIYEIKMINVGSEVDFPNFKNYDVFSGPNVMQYKSITNGELFVNKTITWHLKPKELGQYFIEPISIVYREKVYEADAIELNVFSNPDGMIDNLKENSLDDFFNTKRPPLIEPIDPPKTKEDSKKSKRKLKKG